MQKLFPGILFLACAAALAAAGNLEIYCIDVEGGQATLLVSPSGESMLVDAGWAGFNRRDAGRIASAATTAGVKKIDSVHTSPGLLDLWQLHYAVAAGKDHNSADPFIANVDEICEGKWIRATVRKDGTFTVYNSRNKYEKSY